MAVRLGVCRAVGRFARYAVPAVLGFGDVAESAIISLPSNIAEGCSRRQPVAYVNHPNIAMGSEGELGTQLLVGQRLGYISARDLEKPLDELSQIGRMTNGLAGSIEASDEFQDAQRGVRRRRK